MLSTADLKDVKLSAPDVKTTAKEPSKQAAATETKPPTKEVVKAPSVADKTSAAGRVSTRDDVSANQPKPVTASQQPQSESSRNPGDSGSWKTEAPKSYQKGGDSGGGGGSRGTSGGGGHSGPDPARISIRNSLRQTLTER